MALGGFCLSPLVISRQNLPRHNTLSQPLSGQPP
jgi:hypothetical protein